MTSAPDLLRRGYFPKELPPPFTTERYADWVQSMSGGIPPNFGKEKTKTAYHSLARAGMLRRILGIPNPTAQYRLCDLVSRNWPTLDKHAQSSKMSLSFPRVGASHERALVPNKGHDQVVIERTTLRSRGKYALRTDISRCYPSIYTHSIPWALYGKAVAKKDKNSQSLGNRLDRCVRSGQDQETQGLPIGPDTSLLIAELILSAIDLELCKRHSRIRGIRHYDDYEFVFVSRSEADEVLGILGRVLQDFNLSLGDFKTRIMELPAPVQPPWRPELSRFNFENAASATSQRSSLITYFDKAFDWARRDESSRDAVLKYAVRRLRSVDVHPTNFDLVQAFLRQCLLVEGGTFDAVIPILMKYHSDGLRLDLDSLAEVLNCQIAEDCLAGHGSEVTWCIWALIYWGIPLDSQAAAAVTRFHDPLVPLLALDAYSRGLVPHGLALDDWCVHMDRDGLYGENWLLSYEANVKGWLPSTDTADHVTADPWFKLLKENNVSFYDGTKAPSSVKPGQPIYADLIDLILSMDPYAGS